MTERKRKKVEEDRMKEEIYKGKEEEEGERRGEEESSNRSNPRRERERPVSCFGTRLAASGSQASTPKILVIGDALVPIGRRASPVLR